MKYSPLVVFAMISFCSSAQSNSIKIYLNSAWKPVKDTSNASYYRMVEPLNGKFMVHDYYMNGQLQMEALCTAYEPKLQWEGITKLYHENGVVSEEGLFKNEDRYGLHRYWYDNGSPEKEVLFRSEERIYRNYWSRSGQQLLVKGCGVISEQSKKGDLHYTEFKDSLITASFAIEGSDSIYFVLKKIPEYVGGYKKLASDIGATLIYPRTARRNDIQGTVFVQFMIDKQGAICNIKVLKGVSSECDAEAVRTVKTLNHWAPGYHKGKPVLALFVLPIKFKLN